MRWARARIKPRDVFDLWWLCEKETPYLTPQALHTRLEIYPVPSGKVQDTATVWLANAAQRLLELQALSAAKDIATDLKRWLPSSWPMHEPAAAAMLAVSITQLQAGMALMQSLASGQGTR